MSKKRVLVCDDDRKTRERWRRRLQDCFERLEIEFEAYMLETAGTSRAFDALEERRAQARSKGFADGFPLDEANELDKADVFIIDFDLFQLEDRGYVTGENLAYLARCYSSCGFIIAVNQFEEGRNDFDLALTGHPETFADLHLGDPQLFNVGLWAEPWKGFRPWAWPLLPLALKKFEQRVSDLGDHLDQSILEFLELTGLERSLPRSALEFMTRADKPREVTFSDFVTRSGNGLKHKDMPFSRESIARIAATRLAKWLETKVLPGQDILVDAPHLVSRYPSLLGTGSESIDAWSATATFASHEELGLDPVADESRFHQVDWVSRPVWIWDKINRCDDIREIADPWSTPRPDWVFCEDVSCFLPREAAREFVADVSSQFVRRFVVDFHSPDGEEYADALREVTYRPVSRLSQ